MYCIKGKWRVNGKTRSPELFPVYARVASALLPFFSKWRHLLLHSRHSWAPFEHFPLHTPTTPSLPLLQVPLRSPQLPLTHQIRWLRRSDKSYVPDCFGSWPSPDMWADRLSPIVHWSNYLTVLKQLGSNRNPTMAFRRAIKTSKVS